MLWETRMSSLIFSILSIKPTNGVSLLIENNSAGVVNFRYVYVVNDFRAILFRLIPNRGNSEDRLAMRMTLHILSVIVCLLPL